MSASAGGYAPPDWVASGVGCRVVLRITKRGEEKGQIDIDKPFLTIGRNSNKSDIVAGHNSLSRRHALFAFASEGSGGGFWVMDLGSSRGTFVNGLQLEPHQRKRLETGDKLTLGASAREYVVQIQPLEASAAHAPASAGDGAASAPEEVASAPTAGAAPARPAMSLQEAIASMSGPVPEARAPDTSHHAAGGGSSKVGPGSRKRSRPGIEERGDGGEEAAAEAEDEEEQEEERSALQAKFRRAGIPCAGVARLAGHTGPVYALAMDPNGSRVMTGGTDDQLRIFDFNGMDVNHHSFRQVTALEDVATTQLSASPNGERAAVGTGGARAVVVTFDGVRQVQTKRGDPYLRDLNKTNGHINALSSVSWSPCSNEVFATSSLDGTVRFWDPDNGPMAFDELASKDVFTTKSTAGLRAPCTAMSHIPSGRAVVAAVDGGGLQLWKLKARFTRPDLTARRAHDAPVTAIAFKPGNSYQFASRSRDGSVKVWDTRKMSTGPLATVVGIDTVSDLAGLAWSPDGRWIACGTEPPRPTKARNADVRSGRAAAAAAAGAAAGAGAGADVEEEVEEEGAENEEDGGVASGTTKTGGGLVLVDVEAAARVGLPLPVPGADEEEDLAAAAALEAGAELPVRTLPDIASPGAACYGVLWHPRLNQILVTCGDGCTRVLYDEQLSTRGALLSTSRVASQRATGRSTDSYVSRMAINPLEIKLKRLKYKHLHPGWDNPKLRRIEDPRTKTVPQRPANSTTGAGGQLANQMTFAQYVKQIHVDPDKVREDPRKEIVHFADKANEDWEGRLIARAYKKSQPHRLLAGETIEATRDREEKEEDA